MTGIISIHGYQLDLTDIEYRILILLINQKGVSLNTEMIYKKIWGETFTISSNNNVIVHIKNLRRKISAFDKEVEYIHTVWGKGYAIYV
nr:winged helix-turn-helix domain-containing protein [Clostridium cadaveris]